MNGEPVRGATAAHNSLIYRNLQIAAWLLLAGCGQGQAQGQINAPPAPIASPAAAESLLVDVRSVDSSIAVSLRYFELLLRGRDS